MSLAVPGLALGDDPPRTVRPGEGRSLDQDATTYVEFDEPEATQGQNSSKQGTLGSKAGDSKGGDLDAAKPGAPVVPLVAPSNDECTGAIPIPAGPFPNVTAPVDITDATLGTDPAYCATTDRTVWYTFTPGTTGLYIFSTCAGKGATGSTVKDTVLAIYNSTGGACPAAGSALACNDTDSGCPPVAGFDQSTISAVLTAGQTYFVVAGWWAGAGGQPVVPGNEMITVVTDLSPAPLNDTCSGAETLTLSRALEGTTASAGNDYQSPATAACFSGVGQTPTTSAGRDVVYRFTAPAAGSYSFRMFGQNYPSTIDIAQNFDLYVASDCPASGTVTCIAGANRMVSAPNTSVQNRGEEVACQSLAAGQTVYVYVDNATAGNAGTSFSIEAAPCVPEGEPNDSPATANPLACLQYGSISPAGDADFYQLGTIDDQARVFAFVDGITANTNNFDLRLTSDTDTLEFDLGDGISVIGGSDAPQICGGVGTGVPAFLRVNHNLAAAQVEPYRVMAVVEPPISSAAPAAPEPNNSFAGAGSSTLNYFYGFLTPGDLDVFRFCAEVGDIITVGLDGDPTRDLSPYNPALFAWQYTGAQILGVNDPGFSSNDTASPGTLAGNSPFFPSEALWWRARYTGVHFTGTNGQVPLTFGDYLLSIGINCAKPVRSGDITIAMTGPSGTVATSSIQTYTITITNNGTMAQDVRMTNTLPPELTFVDLTAFGSVTSGLSCTLPPVGSSGSASCNNFCMAPGDTLSYTLTVQVKGCLGGGVSITNTATVQSLTTDTDLSNNSASVTATTTDDGTCSDNDACTSGDRCEGGECVVDGPVDCNDNSVCTDDSCDPAIGCVYDPSPGQFCNDSFPCTLDLCDPVLGDPVNGCYFPFAPAGTACDDGDPCTEPDGCSGDSQFCGGAPKDCDDGNPCTADSCEAGTGACVHTPVAAGTACEDGDACTTGDACDAGGVCVTGSGTLSCDDGNVCTDDSCNPASGCVNTNNTAACSDGNACTTNDTCGGGACIGGPPPNCDDGNLCTDDACNPGTGCFSVPNTVSCDDGNRCTVDDVCSSGVCAGTSPVGNEPNPRTNGYWKRLCQGPHSGDALTAADAACVAGIGSTFAWVTSVADLCTVLEPSHPNNGMCEQTETDLMSLALNICKPKVCEAQGIDSQCGSNSSVGESYSEADGILSSSTRDFSTCQHAKCLTEEINTGRALDVDGLTADRLLGDGVRLTWTVPFYNDGTTQPRKYNVWRRVRGSLAPFAKIGETTITSFDDLTAGEFEYEVTAVEK